MLGETNMINGMLHYLILSGALAISQEAAPERGSISQEQSPIIVTGERRVESDVRDFVHALTGARSQRQLSRFEQSICPVALGLPRPQADAVAKRVRTIAKSLDIIAQGTGCAPNIVVITTTDKKAFLEQLKRQRPDYFGSMSRRELAELMRQPGPAAAWHLGGPTLNERGVEIFFDLNVGRYINRTTDPGSRITMPARPQFDAAVVVVERQALSGLTTTQLADYAAMRAFSGADPSRLANPKTPTILRILDAPMGSEVPVTMTHWDLGFLRGLYAGPRSLSTAAQRSEIRKKVMEEIRRPVSE